ncbi:MAG: 50S ribosomal protein L5 [Planctomycetaceae bacterium]|nr:MAG: 50S ribosomal protein L5 [Planctomycetaceae bacterium]
MARLLKLYREQVIPKLQQELKLKNPLAVPRLEKIVVSMGLGKAIGERKRLEEAVEHLALITGQRPQVTSAKKAVSGFRLRKGMDVGCRVTLRGARMYEFLDRLITLALPRVRDFRGMNPNAFDGRGNYNMGLSEQLVFPEIPADKVNYTQGMNITIVTTARRDDVGRRLLQELGFPFRKAEDNASGQGKK